MKKLLALMAVAGLVSAANAQNSTVLYGTMDIGVRYETHVNAADDSVVKMNNGALSTSRIGVLSSEDLGNGLTAKVKLEGTIAPSTGVAGNTGAGGTALFDRAAWVGVSNKQFGEVQIGRNTLAVNDLSVVIDPLSGKGEVGAPANAANATYSVSPLRPNQMISMVGNSSGVRNTRSDGMIKWLGKVGPVDLILGYSAGGTAGNDNKSSWNGGAKVTYGPVTAAVATAALTDAAGKKMTVNGFGGRYAFGDFTVSAGRYTHENDAGYVGANLTTYGTYTGPVLGTAAATGPATESSVNALGVEYKVNPKLTTSLAVYRGTYENGLGKKGKLNSEVFLAEYAMSKRTSLYAFVDRADPSGDIASKTVTKDVIGYAVGIKHTF